jgi:hypothetical protein
MKKALVGLAVVVMVGLRWGMDVGAVGVTIGDGSAGAAGNVYVDKQVMSVQCVYGTSEMKVYIGITGGIQTAIYAMSGNATVDACKDKVKDVVEKLFDAGLVARKDANLQIDGRYLTVAAFNLDTPDPAGSEGGSELGTVATECSSILPDWCDQENGGGIWSILQLILTILTFGVGVAATVGLVIAGIQYLTARDNEDSVRKAKARIFNVVIGVVVWGVMWLALQWLLPGGIFGDGS